MSQPKYTISGTVFSILPVERVGNYDKQCLILETDGYQGRKEFSQYEFFSKSMAQIVNAQPGQSASIEFEVKGRIHGTTGKCYTTLSGWRFTIVSQGTSRRQEREAEPEYRHATDQFSRPPSQTARDYRSHDKNRPVPEDDGSDYSF